jgi:glycosyltransferase involved in cell wall biosynthesis
MVRVAIVSTFPPAECGIGNYTRELVGALRQVARDIEVTVIAERTDSARSTDKIVRAWHRRGDWHADILHAVDKVQPDVVHVQHEESIFGNRSLLPLLHALRERGIAIVVTLHTLHDTWRCAGFHRELARVCDVLVAHQRLGMAAVLEAQGVAGRQIEVIPHGTPTLELPDAAFARDMLELPQDAPIALFFGFIHYGKGLHVALTAFERAHRAEGELGDARFVIAGRMRMNHVLDRIYAAWLRRLMAPGIAAGRIIFRPGYVPPHDKRHYFAAANLIVLPHNQSYGSASGVLHEAIAARRAVLCTRGKKFAEAVEALAEAAPEMFPAPGDVAAWQRGFTSLLGDSSRQAAAGELVASMEDATSWSSSAARHARIYRGIAIPSRELSRALEVQVRESFAGF